IAGGLAIQEHQNRRLLVRTGDPTQRFGDVIEKALTVRATQLVENRRLGDTGPGAVDPNTPATECYGLAHGVQDDRFLGQPVAPVGQSVGMTVTPLDALG